MRGFLDAIECFLTGGNFYPCKPSRKSERIRNVIDAVEGGPVDGHVLTEDGDSDGDALTLFEEMARWMMRNLPVK